MLNFRASIWKPSAASITAASGCTTLISELSANTPPSAIPASFHSCRIASSPAGASLSAATSMPAVSSPCCPRSVTHPSHSSSWVGSSRGWRSVESMLARLVRPFVS